MYLPVQVHQQSQTKGFTNDQFSLDLLKLYSNITIINNIILQRARELLRHRVIDVIVVRLSTVFRSFLKIEWPSGYIFVFSSKHKPATFLNANIFIIRA